MGIVSTVVSGGVVPGSVVSGGVVVLFRGLKSLTLTLQSTKALKILDTDFWKAFRQDCPGLVIFRLQTSSGTTYQLTMEDLVKGTAIETMNI
ncbi:hypothetical protein BDN72DRAFT_849493 [Pluteus cervinus]|uniref:Uncharacterized protein n=1 Tax=Pluteus cervinus TaxID=181527 RepID=A0ACD3A7H2_9AGAR|nr:hypothetical protein BDN72DRAFT_849493 [Pluteus cervinus]